MTGLPELVNESEEVNLDSHQYVDNDSTNRRKSVKQKCRNLHSETAETCTVTQESADNLDEVKCTLRCDYCGRFAKDSEITFEWNMRPDRYLMCRKCKEKENA